MNANSDLENNPYGGSIDADIADLMGISPAASPKESAPGFTDLFGGPAPVQTQETEETDFSKQNFQLPEHTEESKPRPVFLDKDYYKKVLLDEGEPAQRLHKLMSQFLNSEDPKDRSLYRGKLISAYWNLGESIAHKIYNTIPEPKRMMFRYGYLLPNLVSPEQRNMLSRIVFEHDGQEPFYYIDEWIIKVATGQINPSATDETKQKKRNDDSMLHAQMEKARGYRDIQVGIIRNKMATLESCENLLKENMFTLQDNRSHPRFPDLKDQYNSEQKRALNEISNMVREISAIDKELTALFLDLDRVEANFTELKEKAREAGMETHVDAQVITSEYNTVKQMAKLSVGRQGNHMPILMKQYFRANIRELGTRENITLHMASVEAIDPGLFIRTFKRQNTRIVPNVIILPCYGERGICWEPFEKFNRATSRGRVGIPLFPKDLKEAVITAMADLRWQVSKEKAQHYWMEEGLTGRYYQWFSERRMRGDIKESFIQDYLLWITKESEGTQKLDREVRSIFWRYVPFPDELRENLKNRGFVYSDLYKKDINRSMSDGY